MQTENRLLHDLARLAGAAVGTMAGVKEEIEMRLKQRLETLLDRMDLVNRDEFEAVKALAAAARAENERLAARLDELEAALEKERRRRGPRAAAARAKPGKGKARTTRKRG